MTFKDSPAQFQIIDPGLIGPDAGHPRQHIEEGSLKGLVNSIEKMGLIHPIIVRPAVTGGYTVIAGERRRQAAILAGEKTVPVIVRDCAADAALEVQVFENIGLGVRSPLEARDMAKALQRIATQFASAEEAARHFARPPTWLAQATAPANLSEKVSALLDSGKITGTGTAVQLDKLAKKGEASATTLIGHIEQLPEGEKLSKKTIDHALAEAGGRRKKAEPPAAPAEISGLGAPAAPAAGTGPTTPAWEEAPQAAAPTARSKVNPGKFRQVAEILGLSDDNEEEILIRLIDEFLALKQA